MAIQRYQPKKDENASQRYFNLAFRGQVIDPVSAGLNTDLTPAQKVSSKNAPVTSFGNAVLDDFQRDVFFHLFLFRPGIKETPPENREVNRRLLDWLLADPRFNVSRFGFTNMLISAASAAYSITEELMENPQIQQGMSGVGQAESMENKADDLDQRAEDQENGDGQDELPGVNEPQTSPEEKREQAKNLRQQAQEIQAKAESMLDQAMQSEFNSAVRAGALKDGEDAGRQVQAFLSSWGVDEGEGLTLSIEAIRSLMELMSVPGLSNLTQLMGRVYDVAAKVLRGRAPMEISVDSYGETKDLLDVDIDQQALLVKNGHVPTQIRDDAISRFVRHGLPGVVRKSQAKREGIFIGAADFSGSMTSGIGDGQTHRNEVAMALSLGLARAAKENGQEFVLFGFGDAVEKSDVVSDLTPLPDLLKWAVSSFGGGTDFDAALKFADNILWSYDEDQRRTADVLIITDGQAGVERETAEQIQYNREQWGVRFHVLQIGGASYGNVEEIADNVLEFTDLDQIAEKLANAVWVDGG